MSGTTDERDDRRVFVTGAARGLGRGIAESFARRGATVYLGDIDLERAHKTAGEIAAGPDIRGRCLAVGIDVSSEQSVRRAFREAAGDDPITVLVNNAGICSSELFEELTAEQWNRIMAVNAGGAFLCTQAVLPGMKRAGGGKIVNIGSFAGRTGGIMVSAAYSASKAAVAGLTKAAAKQLAGFNVQVNCVAPSTLQTDMTAGWDAERLAELSRTIPAGRLGTVEDVAGVVLFLCSTAADYVTGATVDVNGGLFIAP